MRLLLSLSILMYSLSSFAQTSIPRHDLLDDLNKMRSIWTPTNWTLHSYTMPTPNPPYQLISQGPSHRVTLGPSSEGLFVIEEGGFGENYNIKLTFKRLGSGGTLRFDFAGNYTGDPNYADVTPGLYVSNFIEFSINDTCGTSLNYYSFYPFGSVSVKTRDGFYDILTDPSGVHQTSSLHDPHHFTRTVPCLNFHDALLINSPAINTEAEYKLIAYVRGSKATIFLRDANRKTTFKLGTVTHLITGGLEKNMFHVGANAAGVRIVNLLLDDIPG